MKPKDIPIRWLQIASNNTLKQKMNISSNNSKNEDFKNSKKLDFCQINKNEFGTGNLAHKYL